MKQLEEIVNTAEKYVALILSEILSYPGPTVRRKSRISFEFNKIKWYYSVEP